jgi:hypothetical protein
MAARIALCALFLAVLAACSKPDATASSGQPASGPVGYVRMDVLVKSHPLYSQLAAYEKSIEALSLREIGPGITTSGRDVGRQAAELQTELRAAAERTNRLLKQKQDEYSRREHDAIEAALAGTPAGPTASQIAAGLNSTSANQQSSAATQARQDLGAYKSAVVAQDKSAGDALVKTYNDRASRLYRDKAAQLQAQESQYSLQLAQADAAQRLQLRTKLSNLALDDAGRKDAQAQLETLDKKESDALAVMRTKDQQTLAQYQGQLRGQMTGDLDKQLAALHGRTQTKLGAPGSAVENIGSPTPVGINAGKGPGQQSSPAALRAKLEALHRRYQDQFNADAKQTIADFNKTRDDLEHRFEQLQTADASAQNSAQQQLTSLQKQHDELYAQIVAQIQREVKTLATNRGIAVVFSDVVAPGGSIDLTQDAEKQIESLHE